MSKANDPARWMWAEACELIDQAERLQRQFFGHSWHCDDEGIGVLSVR